MEEQLETERNQTATRDQADPGIASNGPLWTVDDVAQYLRLKPETVRNKVRKGELPAIKLGRVWRFRPRMIEAWITEQHAQGLAEIPPE